MRYSEDHAHLKKWMPIVMDGRSPQQQVAGTYVPVGTDVNFDAVTRSLVKHLQSRAGVAHAPAA